MVWVQGAAAGGLIAASPGIGLLVCVMVCPAFAYALFEDAKNKPVARAMLLCGLAPTLSSVRSLWEQGGSIADASDILSDPANPLTSWLCCFGGWLVCEVLDIAARLYLRSRAKQTVSQIVGERVELAQEWGLTNRDAKE